MAANTDGTEDAHVHVDGAQRHTPLHNTCTRVMNVWGGCATSVHSSLSLWAKPHSCSSCHHRHLHHRRCSTPLGRGIYLTFALEILDRETRTLRFASAFLLSALLHLIIMHSGFGASDLWCFSAVLRALVERCVRPGTARFGCLKRTRKPDFF